MALVEAVLGEVVRLMADHTDKLIVRITAEDQVTEQLADNQRQHADPVRTSYGFDGLRDGVFPPTYIWRWVNWRTVSTKQLIGELRFWANHLEARLDAQHDGGGADD